jgi:hypothetical protein
MLVSLNIFYFLICHLRAKEKLAIFVNASVSRGLNRQDYGCKTLPIKVLPGRPQFPDRLKREGLVDV